MESRDFQFWTRMGTMNQVGTARRAVRAAFSGATVPPAIARAGTSQRDVPTRVWFIGSLHLQFWTRMGAMNLGRHVGQACSLPVRAASLPLKCSAGKDARRTGSQDGCPATARFMEKGELDRTRAF